MAVLNFKGKEIHYHCIGDPNSPCLLFLHGYMESSTMWKKFHYLQNRYYLIFIDLPGHGSSDVIYRKHSMPLQAHIAQQILNKQGIQKAKIIGHSMGGYIGLAMAKYYPNYCDEIILINSHPFADDPVKILQRKAALLIVSRNKDRYCTLLIPNLFIHPERHPEEIKTLIKEAKEMTEEGIIAAVKGMMSRADYQSFLKQKSIKCSYILGAQDEIIPHPEIIEKVFPDSPVFILKDAGHMSHIEDWENCKNSLEKLLD